MDLDWAASLDNIWRSPNLLLYLTLAAGCFVGIIVLITLLRSERSVANGVLALITLLAVGVAGAVTFRGYRAIAAAFLHRRAGRRCRSRSLREGAVRFGRVGGCGCDLRRLADHAVDL